MATKNKSLKPRQRSNIDYSHTIDFLDKHEGFEGHVYPDGKGIPTIGYGFTDPAYIKMGTMSKDKAKQILQKELINRDRFLSRLKNWDNLGEGGKTALRSYYYNYPAGFKEATKFMQAWNAGNYEEAIRQVDAGWNDAANRGLRNRRQEEQELLRNDPFIMSVLNNNWKLPVPKLTKQNEEMQFQPWENYHGTDYPINNPAPSSISSWNSSQSPAYTQAQLQGSKAFFRLPNIREVVEEQLWKPVFKNGKLPGYRDGKRYIKNDDDTWTRITDDQMADQFANLVVTPSSNREERVVRRPDTYDALLRKSIHDAGYVTDWALERDAANRRKVAMAARHAEDPLETVYPEFDLLLAGQVLKPIVKKGYQKAADKVLNSKFVQNRTFVNNESALGDLLGDGSEQTVFVNRRNPSEVLKVYDGTNQKTVNDAKELANKMIELRNSAPQVPIRRYGYVLQDGRIKPVFAQKRLNNLVDPEIRWNDPEWISYQKQLDDLFNSNGWAGKGTYTKGNLTASDVQPGNIGFYDDGTIAPFDIDVSAYANGKFPIHIKPANRGKLTNLKKRTGKSEAELYKTGGPAVRKMITFARNARKWKH